MWCYECGAFRVLRHITETQVEAASGWVRPVGIGGENPFDKWKKTWKEAA